MKGFRFWRRGDGDGADSPRDGGFDPAGALGGATGGPSGLLSGDPVEDSRTIEILLESIAEVTANVDLDQVLEGIVDRTLQVTDAERAVLLLGADPESAQIRVARDKTGAPLGNRVQYSRSVVAKALTEEQPVKSVVQSDQQALELGQSVHDLKLRAVMCAPMNARGRMIGAIYVDSRAVRREFTSRDLALFGALSAQLAIAIENARLHADSLEKVRLEKDVEIARRIQQHLLPAIPEDIPGVDLALRYRAAEQASGDTYDVMNLADGRVVVLIGDVTGHGIGAALLTHAAQAAVRSYLELLDDMSQVVTRLNRRLAESVETGNFMSFLLVEIEPTEQQIRYVNAGHPGLMIVRADGTVDTLGKTGMVLGVVGDQEYPVSDSIQLGRGDVLFLRTDGVDETMSPDREMFGEQRIREVLAAHRECSAEEILQEIDSALVEWARGSGTGTDTPCDDDLTMIAFRLHGKNS